MKTRQALLERFKGMEAVVPNLYQIFPGWPQGEVNPNYSRLVDVSVKKLERYTTFILC
jgi:hypothetical protein